MVKFLETLTDGYTSPYPDINTYTGVCQTGGNASTQGNSTIISADAIKALMRER
jgi:cytochrome c peroxidase